MAVYEANLDGLSYSVPSCKLTNDKSYYWRVSASRDGETSGWSGYWYFQTPPPTPTQLPELDHP